MVIGTEIDVYADASDEDKTTYVKIAVEKLLNREAQLSGYDSILTACSYAGYPNEFQTESLSFAQWRSNVWTYCYQELEKVKQGLIPEPTVEEFLAILPQLNIGV